MKQEENNIIQAPFKFKDFIIKETRIKIESDAKTESIEVKIDPKGTIFEEKKIFEIQLLVNLISKNCFDISVQIIGIFEFKDVVNIENLRNYFYINAPAIIFPYIRSYISALSALSGIRTIIIPPMNMTRIGEKLEKNTVSIKD